MLNSVDSSKNIYTVTNLNRTARAILESEFGLIWLSAEISNFVAASSGHWYFTLKDSRAQIRGAMFKGANRKVIQRPKNGDKVLLRASISIYEPRGDYQLIVEHLEPEGEGLLKQQFEQLKMALSAEGLFANEYKKPLPQTISTVGIVTSATGAALHDILTVMRRRNPATKIIVYPSQVQGQIATEQICNAIQLANRRNEVDVLIVGRGGGSLEDLWCFNEEAVARQIFASAIPVVSAVGHEVDITIADYVADIRAATPSAAAELVTQDQQEQLQIIHNLFARLTHTFSTQFKQHKYQFDVLSHRLQRNHPETILQQQAQHADQLQASLVLNMQRIMTDKRHDMKERLNRLDKQSPQNLLQQQTGRLAELTNRLTQGSQLQIERSQHRLATASQLLNTVSPLATLSRGYNISFQQGEIVRSVSQVKQGDQLTTKVSDGEFTSTITKIN